MSRGSPRAPSGYVDPSPTPAFMAGDPPTLSQWGQRLYDRTRPLSQYPDSEPENGYAHAILAEAFIATVLRAYEIADPADPVPPLAPLLDPDLCPPWALPWLAMLVGAQLPEGMPEEPARALIRDVPGWRRGSAAALIAAVQQTLTGDRAVWLRERQDGDPWALGIATLTAETPDPAATLAAAIAAKPAGLVLTATTVASWDYKALADDAAARAETYAQTATHYADYIALSMRDRQ